MTRDRDRDRRWGGPLRGDIGISIPEEQLQAFLTATDTAEPEAAADVVDASVILDSLTADTSDLQSAGLVSAEGLSAIATDVNSLESELFTPSTRASPDQR